MTATTLHDSQSQLLGFLTIAVAQCLGDAATMMLEEDKGVRKLQMARVDEIVLLDHPADATGSRSINCYLVDVQDFAATLSPHRRRFRRPQQPLRYWGSPLQQLSI